MPIPTVCRIVAYTLTEQNAEAIRTRRKAGLKHAIENALGFLRHQHEGNSVMAGDVFPLLITRVWGDTEDSYFNGTVFLDGGDTLWVTSTKIGEGEGACAWPGQAPAPKAETPAPAETSPAQIAAQAQDQAIRSEQSASAPPAPAPQSEPAPEQPAETPMAPATDIPEAGPVGHTSQPTT